MNPPRAVRRTSIEGVDVKRGFVALAAVLAVVALPAAADAGRSCVSGVVVAKQAQRGTFAVVGRRGAVQTVHGRLSRVHLGDRVRAAGSRLADGTVRASTTQVVGHVRSATVRGVVISRNAERTLVAAGRSVNDQSARSGDDQPAGGDDNSQGDDDQGDESGDG